MSAIGDISFGRAVAFIPRTGYVPFGTLPTVAFPGARQPRRRTPGYPLLYEQNRINVIGATVSSGGIFPNWPTPQVRS